MAEWTPDPTKEDAPARARVFDEIVELMTSARWRASKSHRDLAAKHGVSHHYVKRIATEAGRWIHGLMTGTTEEEREAARGRILARLEDTRQRALDQVKVYVTKDGQAVEYPAPDFRAAIEVDKLELLTLGLMAPKQPQELPLDEVARMTRHEKIVAHRNAIAELEEEISRERGRLDEIGQ